MLDSPDLPAPLLDDPRLDDAALERLLGVAKHRSARRRGRRRRAATAVAASLTAVLLVVVGAVVVTHPAGEQRPARRTPVAGRGGVPAPAPKWRLVSDLSGRWQVSGSAGEGVFLDCPAAGTCYAGDARALQGGSPCCSGILATVEVTRNGGATWRSSKLPVALVAAGSPSCSDALTCAILGFPARGRSVLLRTTDGGKDWTTAPGPAAISPTIGAPGWAPWWPFIQLACTSATSCVAATTELAVDQPAGQAPGNVPGVSRAFSTTDGGRTWTASSLPYGFVPEALACAESGSCVATGFEGADLSGTAMSRDSAGAGWTAASLPPDAGELSALSCTDGTSDCLATFFGDHVGNGVTSLVLVTTDGGRSWSPSAAGGLPASATNGISCVTATTCFSGGTTTGTGTGIGYSFALAPEVPGAGVVLGISGSRRTAGTVDSTSDGGTTWTAAQLPAGITAVTGISCPEAADCYALAVEGWPPAKQVYVLLSDSAAAR